MAAATARVARPCFTCSSCAAEAPRWEGRCPSCGDWNSLAEAASRPQRPPPAPVLALHGEADEERRLPSGFDEVDRVLGGGIVAGSVILLGGDPGVGKSTLALQIADLASVQRGSTLYCSGEESAGQLRMRARRLGCACAAVEVVVETALDDLVQVIEQRRPGLAMVDSVQTVSDRSTAGMAGSPAQVRAVVARLVAVAKATGVPIILIGHVTKEGAIAGPRTLEHMVDVVLYLEGDRLGEQRLLRGVKNRFGSTGEVGLLAMGASGMDELQSPSRAFLDGATAGAPGSAVTITCEGIRPLGIELQALTVKTSYGLPRRTVSGFDLNRLHMVLAVLERRSEVRLGDADVFVNAAGGMRLADPAADLAAVLAIAGAHTNRTLPEGTAALGEVGLGGEVRRVSRLEARLAEAATLGLELALVPPGYSGRVPRGVSCRPVHTVREALRHLR